VVTPAPYPGGTAWRCPNCGYGPHVWSALPMHRAPRHRCQAGGRRQYDMVPVEPTPEAKEPT
jgi:hypothetical protein